MPALPDRELSRAVLIGASRFQHLPDLPSIRNNLADLRAGLTDPAHGIIAPENCVIVEEPDSPLTFMTSLRHAIGTTDDFLFVYYAGHGLKNDAGDQLYLTVDQTEPGALDGSAVPFEWVKRALEDNRARASLLVLDCCYSGMAAGIMADGGVSRWEIQVRGSAVLASSPRNRTSHSPEGHRHTAFTGKMIHLLENGSPILDEPLTVNTLYRRVSVALTKERFPEPKLALTETSGDLLVRKFSEPPRRPRLELVAPQPVLDPEPPTVRMFPTDRATPAALPSGYAMWIELTWLRTLWTLTSVFLAMGLGGIVGVLTGARRPDGSQGDDMSTFWIGFVMTTVFGVPLWLKRKRWLSLRQELAPPLITRSATLRVLVLVGFAVCVLMLVTTFTAETSTKVYADSDVVYATGLGIIASEGVLLCGYMLLTWWRARTAARAGQAPDSGS